MFGIFLQPVYWVLYLVLECLFLVLENVFFWLLPILRTTQVIREKKDSLNKQYMSFWTLLALLLSVEYLTLNFVFWLPFYRVLRLAFVIWIQMDECRQSLAFINLSKPVVDDNRENLDRVFQKVDKLVSEGSGVVLDNMRKKGGELLQEHGDTIIKQAAKLVANNQSNESSSNKQD